MPRDKRVVVVLKRGRVVVPPFFGMHVTVVSVKKFKMLLRYRGLLNINIEVLRFVKNATFRFCKKKVARIDLNALTLLACRANGAKKHFPKASKPPFYHLLARSAATIFYNLVMRRLLFLCEVGTLVVKGKFFK